MRNIKLASGRLALRIKEEPSEMFKYTELLMSKLVNMNDKYIESRI